MGESNIELQTITDLLEKNFFIPNYQRGYRWTKQQVKDLLNDIDDFKVIIDSKTKKESWYCLQPLVVKKMSSSDIAEKSLVTDKNDKDWYEVVDGQQRIITIFLFIHYFNEKWIGEDKLSEPNISFETRKESFTFLKLLKIDNDMNVLSGNILPDDTIDFQHISDAYKQIREWVKSKESNFDNNKFQSKFKSSTKVIWYEIEDNSNPIDIFTRINIGKIPLRNSELIKALFLRKRNFDNTTAELRQIEIANEWDRMEYALQNDDFWWFLNKKENDIPARIEFLFDFMCRVDIKDSTDLESKIGNDDYRTFRFFNEKFPNGENITNDDSIIRIWNEVKDFFLAFEDWFNEPIWYHYIGYLIYCETETPIDWIYNIYKGVTKDKFLQELKNKIKEKFKGIKCEKLANDGYRIDLAYKGKNVKEFLLLFNIEYIVRQYDEKRNVFIRFPFELFKKESWDIEHIDSFTEKELSGRETQNEWLERALGDLGDDIVKSSECPNLKKEIEQFLNPDINNEEKFTKIKDEIIKIAGEHENTDEEKNRIGNLALLDARTNRAYGNALFPTKRRIIIEKDSSGTFIPICTKNVFLKYFDIKGSSRNRWTSEDIANYQNHIGVTLEEFLTFNGVENNEK